MCSFNLAFVFILLLHLNMASLSWSRVRRPRVIDLVGSPASKSSITLKWNVSRILNEDSAFIIRYGYDRSSSTKEITTNGQVYSYTLNDLKLHTTYRFRVAPIEEGKTGIYSSWLKIPLDVSAYIVKAQLPSEMKSAFKQALNEVLPLSLLGSELLNSTKIDLDTSMSEVFYEIYFNVGVNFSSTELTAMFARNHARIHTSYVRNVKVYLPQFCRSGRNLCHKFAKCTESYGTYSCECRTDYIDLNVRSHVFPGRNCSLNTAEPGNMIVTVVNPTTVKVKFRFPRQTLGYIVSFEIEHSRISGESVSKPERVEIERRGLDIEKTITGLLPNGLHQFRTRAVTNVADGKWTKSKQVRTSSSVFKLVFFIQLNSEVTNFFSQRNKIVAELQTKAKRALEISRSISLTDLQISKSAYFTNGTARVEFFVYTKKMRIVSIRRLLNSAKIRLNSRFNSRYGTLHKSSIYLGDYDECFENANDCGGSRCRNGVGTFRCECPANLIDISDDFKMLEGRKCIEKRVDILENSNFTEASFVATTIISDLTMMSIYQFRVAVANLDNTGRYTQWKTVQTSNLIFNAKLNLTQLIYSTNLLNEHHALTNEATNKIKITLDAVLDRMSQYTTTGNITFSPGIRGRTFAFVNLFFKKEGNTEAKLIQESFKHSGNIANPLGIDFNSVHVTDFNECLSPWNDCSPHANCTDKISGYTCTCKAEYIDMSSRENNKAPGRLCVHQDDTTTPAPTTATKRTTATTVPLRFPKVVLKGDAIGPHRIRLHWIRRSSNKLRMDGLNYVLRYGIKGLSEKYDTTVAATTQSVDISHLHQGVIYEIQVAERWTQNANPHTLYSIPIEVRTNPKAYRIFVQLADISPTQNILADSSDPQKSRLQTFLVDYFIQIYSNPDVINKYKTIKFGSMGKITFSRHPDRGVIASSILYLSKTSRATIGQLGRAFQTGEPLVTKPIGIEFMYIGDLDECSADNLNDCSPTSECSNKQGSFRCECNPGFSDVGPAYYLLPGRICQSNNPPSTTLSISKSASTTTSSTRWISTQTTKNSRISTILSSTTTTIPIAIEPKNMIGLLSGQCKKGQKMMQGVCQDVDLYLGRIDIMKESGNNVTASNLLGDGKESLKGAVELALNTLFSEIESFTGFSKCKIQELSSVKGKIQAVFVIILNSQNLRYKREINFIVTDIQIDANFIQKSLMDYLNEGFPVGIVKPAAGAAVVFGTKDILISDVNECSTRSLHDCDVNLAQCSNTMGGFLCRCREGTSDVSSDVENRPGRQCRDQCNPSPCLNGGQCLTQLHVGEPQCKCKPGFKGSLCDTAMNAENNLIVIAVSSLAGVLLFLVGFIVTYRVHRKNKKETSNQNSSQLSTQNDAYVSAVCDGRSSVADKQFDPKVDSLLSLENVETSPECRPPSIPARTTSEQSAQTTSYFPIPFTQPKVDTPNLNLPILSPILSTQSFESTANFQQNISSHNYPSTNICNNPPKLSSISSIRAPPAAVPQGQKTTDYPSSQPSQYPLEFPSAQRNKSKKGKREKLAAIRGRIRKHSDSE